MQPPSNAAIDAAFAADAPVPGWDWFDPNLVAMLRSQVCQWIEKAKTVSASGEGTAAPRAPIEPCFIGAAWVALMGSRELTDPHAADWRQFRH